MKYAKIEKKIAKNVFFFLIFRNFFFFLVREISSKSGFIDKMFCRLQYTNKCIYIANVRPHIFVLRLFLPDNFSLFVQQSIMDLHEVNAKRIAKTIAFYSFMVVLPVLFEKSLKVNHNIVLTAIVLSWQHAKINAKNETPCSKTAKALNSLQKHTNFLNSSTSPDPKRR